MSVISLAKVQSTSQNEKGTQAIIVLEIMKYIIQVCTRSNRIDPYLCFMSLTFYIFIYPHGEIPDFHRLQTDTVLLII